MIHNVSVRLASKMQKNNCCSHYIQWPRIDRQFSLINITCQLEENAINAGVWWRYNSISVLQRGFMGYHCNDGITTSRLYIITSPDHLSEGIQIFRIIWTNGFLHFLQTVKAFNINVIQLFIFTGTKHKMCTYFAIHPNKFIIASESQV